MESVLAWREFYVPVCLDMGILGIVFFLVSWLPHGILYLAALALLLLVEPHRFYNRKNPWLLRLAWGMGVAVLVLLGCVFEASVGIRLLRFVVEKL